MAYDIKCDSVLRMVEIVITGVLSEADLREMTSKVILIEKEIRAKAILVDARDLESELSIAAVMELPHQYEEEGARRSARIALVSPRSPKAQTAVHFYERFCSNRGWTVQ